MSPAGRWGRRIDLAWRWAPRFGVDALVARRTRLPGGARRVYLYHVRKTAGTALATAFMALGGEDPAAVYARLGPRPHVTRSGDRVYATYEAAVLRRGDYFFGWSHQPWWHLDLPGRTFTVTVLRDPVERVVSLYRYLADPASDAGLPFPAPGSDRAWAADGFGPFLDRLPPGTLCNQLYTFSRDLEPGEAAERIRATSLWFFTADFAAGLAELGRRLDLPLVPHRARVSTPSGDGPTAAERARLRRALEPEYELLARLRARPGPGLVGAVPEEGAARRPAGGR